MLTLNFVMFLKSIVMNLKVLALVNLMYLYELAECLHLYITILMYLFHAIVI